MLIFRPESPTAYMIRFFRSLLVALVVAAPAAAQEPVQTLPESQPMLAPGDMVRIAVLSRPDLTGEFMVSADGSIRNPAYQGVRVAGIPLDQAIENVGQFLTRYQAEPRYVVEPLFRIAVGGGVTSPSLYPLPPETTIAQAVATAGGAKTSGDLSKVDVYRNGQHYRVDLTEANTIASLPIRSGDQIIVYERRPRFEALQDASTLLSVVVSAVNLYVLVQNLAN